MTLNGAIKQLHELRNAEDMPFYYKPAIAEVINVLLMDTQEVRHGRWKIKAINTFDMAYGATGYEPVYECSLCGAVEESYLRLDEPIMPEDADFPRYCPNCGALMNGE